MLSYGLLSAALAVSKNQQYWIWLIAGLVFGPIGLISSSYVKDKSFLLMLAISPISGFLILIRLGLKLECHYSFMSLRSVDCKG